MFKRIAIMIAAGTVIAFMSFTAAAQDTVIIHFDGAETGISEGSTEFSFMGSNWTGGSVQTVGVANCYSSGVFSYHVDPGPASVTFDTPMETVTFFYVHSSEVPEGIATASLNAVEVDSASSNAATTFNDPNNFVTFTSDTGIDRIDFTGGVVDSFSYTGFPPPPVSPALVVEGSIFAEEGGDITLSANPGMQAPYQWMKNGLPIGGADGPSHVISNAMTTDSGVYVLEFEDNLKVTALSDPVSITIFPADTLPLAGLMALGLLSATTLLGGAVALRKQK